jgi:hypothetical protein
VEFGLKQISECWMIKRFKAVGKAGYPKTGARVIHQNQIAQIWNRE